MIQLFLWMVHATRNDYSGHQNSFPRGSSCPREKVVEATVPTSGVNNEYSDAQHETVLYSTEVSQTEKITIKNSVIGRQ
jgi:hypothetical protein